MIIVSGEQFNTATILDKYTKNSIERQLLTSLSSGSENYQYDNLGQLEFELKLRKEIVYSAIDLNNSNLEFAIFKKSKCNPKFWIRTENGGFLLNDSVKSSDAISDIFTNGSMYATECATALMIIYYKALLNTYGENSFDKVFTKIFLMSWMVIEPLLREVGNISSVKDILLGDRVYFNNPDFNPKTTEWEGENAIVLPNSLFYGHGIGINEAGSIIHSLNGNRKEGSTQSAYLMKSAGRPNFIKLYENYKSVS